MTRDSLLRLQDIARNVRLAISATKGLSRKDLERNTTVHDACLYRIIVVAEAATKLPAAMRRQHPEVDWSSLIGMGNMLKHQYFRVEAEIVWDTVRTHFPVLERAVKAMIEQHMAELV